MRDFSSSSPRVRGKVGDHDLLLPEESESENYSSESDSDDKVDDYRDLLEEWAGGDDPPSSFRIPFPPTNAASYTSCVMSWVFITQVWVRDRRIVVTRLPPATFVAMEDNDPGESSSILTADPTPSPAADPTPAAAPEPSAAPAPEPTAAPAPVRASGRKRFLPSHLDDYIVKVPKRF
ncbi:hypothetical protein GHT06_018619 [Daphnia sinensis]|uniref:Uncharacterized protein n=1 Tax=Daphnia sinensis TaxID=1820382 RepID=A0AAD5PR00_9CRUS|nr:hypothetical protein GHT06_018619 [Daphnia sinensis]